MTFGDAADRRVARHLRDQVDVECEQRRLQPHARRGHRGLASGVAGADNNDIELFRELHVNDSKLQVAGRRDFLFSF